MSTPDLQPRRNGRPTLLRVLGMLRPWRRWVLLNNVLIVIGSALSVVSLVAVLPLLQLVFTPTPETPVENRATPAAVTPSLPSPPAVSATPWYEVRRQALLSRTSAWASENPRRAVTWICLALGIAALLKLLVQLGSGVCIAVIQTGFVHHLTRKLYYHCLFHDFVLYRWFPPGKLLTRLSLDIQRMQSIVELAYGARIRQPVNLLFLAILLCTIHLPLALAVLTFSCLFVVPGMLLSRKLRSVSRKEVDIDAGLVELLDEQFSSYPLIKIFGAEEHEARRFEFHSQRAFSRRRQRSLLKAAGDPVQELLAMLGIIVVILLGVKLVMRDGVIEGPTYLLFLVALGSFYRPLRKLTTLGIHLQRPLMSAEAVFKVLDAQPRMAKPEDALPFPETWEALRLEGVWFRYSKKPQYPWVLRGADLRVARGDFLAIEGANGSGKTTLALLLTRLYDPGRGRLCIDGIDFRRIQVETFRRSIGFVHQETVIMNLTVAENIAFGVQTEEVDEGRVRQAAVRVGADRFIENLPRGYDTALGPRGEVLSGGQRQLIALARVLYFDFPVIIYDEPVRNLDAHAVTRVQEILEELRGVKTVVCISHRSELTGMADRRVFVEDGRVVPVSEKEMSPHGLGDHEDDELPLGRLRPR